MTNSSSQPTWVSVARAARHLEISENAVRKRIRAGALPSRGEHGRTEVLISDPTTSQPGSQPVESGVAHLTHGPPDRVGDQAAALRAHLADALRERDRWYALAMEARAEARIAATARDAIELELRLLLARQ